MPDLAATSCVPDQYTISLSGLGVTVMPTKTLTTYAKVTTSSGSPKSGVHVDLALTVVPENGDPILASNVGSISPNGGSTDGNGRLDFTFMAPQAGGLHTITATCVGCTNNPVAGTIRVPGCTVSDLTPIADLSALAGETPEQTQLTRQLEGGMDGYSLLSTSTQQAEQCLAGRINTVVGPPSTSGYQVTSTIRTLAYQEHLWEVWDKFWELKRKVDKDPSIQQRCQTLITKVEGEMGFRLTQDPTDKNESCNTALGRAHCVRYEPATDDPKHVAKIAFDIPPMTVKKFELVLWLNQMIDSTVQKEANTCGLNWGGTLDSPDPIHFLLR